jgi:hypothetical protein
VVIVIGKDGRGGAAVRLSKGERILVGVRGSVMGAVFVAHVNGIVMLARFLGGPRNDK